MLVQDLFEAMAKEPKLLDVSDAVMDKIHDMDPIKIDVNTDEAKTLLVYYVKTKTVVIPAEGHQNSEPYAYNGRQSKEDIKRWYIAAVQGDEE